MPNQYMAPPQDQLKNYRIPSLGHIGRRERKQDHLNVLVGVIVPFTHVPTHTGERVLGVAEVMGGGLGKVKRSRLSYE